MLWGQMVTTSVGDPVLDERMRAWTEPVLADARIRRDLVKYARTTFDDAELVRRTEALRDFDGDALVLWAPDNRVMPPEHGPRLAGLLPRGRYAEIRAPRCCRYSTSRRRSRARSAASSPGTARAGRADHPIRTAPRS